MAYVTMQPHLEYQWMHPCLVYHIWIFSIRWEVSRATEPHGTRANVSNRAVASSLLQHIYFSWISLRTILSLTECYLYAECTDLVLLPPSPHTPPPPTPPPTPNSYSNFNGSSRLRKTNTCSHSNITWHYHSLAHGCSSHHDQAKVCRQRRDIKRRTGCQ